MFAPQATTGCTDQACLCSSPINDNGRKIRDEYENPFAVLILKLVDPLVPRAHDAGLTPNMITTLSLIFGLLAIFAVRERRPVAAALMYLISYYFDCLDGPVARRYNQVTDFGDKYDHVKDVLVVVWLFYEINRQYPINWSIWLAFALLFAGAVCHMGLVEQYNSLCCGTGSENNFLRICTWIADAFGIPRDCSTMPQLMKNTKWFSDGSFVFFIVAYLLYASFACNGRSGTDE
jgi:phosphatidylglycerophosphate synthase